MRNKITVGFLSIVLSASFINVGVSQVQKNDSTWFDIQPLKEITFRSFVLSTRYPSLTYRLVNSDGDAIERGWNGFLSFNGGMDFLSRFSASYQIEGSKDRTFSFKKASFKANDFGISLEVARGNNWLGHGVHGSLLLSNNGEPYTFLKFQTENGVKIPYIGSLNYMILHGWPKNFKFFAQRISLRPVTWLELGGNETVQYITNVKWWEIPVLLTGKNENRGGGVNNKNADMRASMDLAIYLDTFFQYFGVQQDGKIYFEYAGDDIYAWWQKEDGKWVWPFGFEFLSIATTAGLDLSWKIDEIKIEYSQNYRSTFLFKDLSFIGLGKYSWPWYSHFGGMNYENGGAIMGHHMGSNADDIYFEYKRKFESGFLKFFYDVERHVAADLNNFPYDENQYPEKLYQYGVECGYNWNAITLKGLFIWNQYKNVNSSVDVLNVLPTPRRDANESILGLQLSVKIN